MLFHVIISCCSILSCITFHDTILYYILFFLFFFIFFYFILIYFILFYFLQIFNYQDLLPKLKEAKHTVDLLNRVTMAFDVVLEKGVEQIPKVKISVINSDPKLSILIDPQEFLPKLR